MIYFQALEDSHLLPDGLDGKPWVSVRLTRTAWKVQLEFRIDLIDRLYMQDTDFYSRYKDETDAVYCDRLKQLCRQQLLSNDQSNANLTLKKYRMHSTNPNIDYFLLTYPSQF